MGQIGKFVAVVLLLVNAFLVGMLLLTAYSSYLHPAVHPLASCFGLVFPLFLVLNLVLFFFWLFVYARYALLSGIALLLCYPQIHTYCPLNFSADPPSEKTFKLLSYNVMGFDGMVKKNGKNRILEYLVQSKADIICLQEYCVSTNRDYLTFRDIRKALKDYRYVSVYGKNKKGTQLACFSKFPILSTKPVDYQSDYNGSVMYTLKMGKDTVMLINNHLESNKLTKEDRGIYEALIDNPNADMMKTGVRQLIRKLAEASAIRSVQVDSVAACIANCNYPFKMVCGDFNDASISYTHQVLTSQLDDAFTQSGRGLGVSFNQNKFYFRIDNILISSNLKSYQCTVDRSIDASDHYPIWCYLSKRI